MSVVEPALRNVVTPNVVDVAFANVAVFDTTKFEVEAVFKIARNLEVECVEVIITV